MTPCLAPVLLAGYLFTLQTPSHHTASFNGPVLEVQTCEVGPAVNVRVAASGISSVGLQYGWQWKRDAWSLTAQPMAGAALLDQHTPELSSQVNFSLGAQLLGGYDIYRMSVGYWHASNAGLGDRNVGLDFIALQTGFSFH